MCSHSYTREIHGGISQNYIQKFMPVSQLLGTKPENAVANFITSLETPLHRSYPILLTVSALRIYICNYMFRIHVLSVWGA